MVDQGEQHAGHADLLATGGRDPARLQGLGRVLARGDPGLGAQDDGLRVPGGELDRPVHGARGLVVPARAQLHLGQGRVHVGLERGARGLRAVQRRQQVRATRGAIADVSPRHASQPQDRPDRPDPVVSDLGQLGEGVPVRRRPAFLQRSQRRVEVLAIHVGERGAQGARRVLVAVQAVQGASPPPDQGYQGLSSPAQTSLPDLRAVPAPASEHHPGEGARGGVRVRVVSEPVQELVCQFER